MSKFYTFNQNNSGGKFRIDDAAGISYYVIVEASSSEDALRRAETIGLYFNGCNEGIDCPCCGDRWYAYADDDDDVPSIYGHDVSSGVYHGSREGYTTVAYIHYMNGQILPVKQG